MAFSGHEQEGFQQYVFSEWFKCQYWCILSSLDEEITKLKFFLKEPLLLPLLTQTAVILGPYTE